MIIDISKDIEIENMDNYIIIIESAAKKTISNLDVSNKFELSIVLTDDSTMRIMNKKYREIDQTTDVLSFPMINNFDNLDTSKYYLLGDVVISFNKAKQQSEDFGHSLERELSFLTIHGVLHLFGFNHIIEKDTKVMRNKEKEILTGLGYSD